MSNLEIIQKVLKVKLQTCESSNILAYGWNEKNRSLNHKNVTWNNP